jgi:hypothetical protein
MDTLQVGAQLEPHPGCCALLWNCVEVEWCLWACASRQGGIYAAQSTHLVPSSCSKGGG